MGSCSISRICYTGMMQFITFDTYEHIEKLKAVGLAEPQAKAIVDAMKQAHTELATRQDVEQLGLKLDAKIDSVERRLDAKIGLLKQDLVQAEQRLDAKIDSVKSALELQIASFKADIIRWILGLFFAQIGLLVGLFKLFS